jgi:16S rRNA (cytosine1402-N4)-methyltransferase
MLEQHTVVSYHTPVLVDVVVQLAAGCRRIVDCTVGAAGHAARLLDGNRDLLAIDRDPEALDVARAVVGSDRVAWVRAGFADAAALAAVQRFRPDFALFDLGVSSHQLDTDARGFSFRRGVALDMRMDPAGGPTAAEVLNDLDEGTLADMFWEYADERRARRLAAVVATRRSRVPFRTSDDLVNAIRAALGKGTGPADFARLFQAVRIHVNGEIDALRTALPAVREALVPLGRIVVISYHSVEDRVVKHQFREWSRACVCPPKAPVCTCRGAPMGTVEPRRAVRPGLDECAANPRARSARLRCFRKADAA